MTNRQALFTTTNGERSDLPIAGPLSVRIGDRGMFTGCVVVDEGAEALVGQIILEELDLIPDPKRRTLGPRHPSGEGLLLRL